MWLQKGDIQDLESQIIQESPVPQRATPTGAEKRPPSPAVEAKKDSSKRMTNFKKKSAVVTDVESDTLTRAAPPRPPPPDDTDVLAVPPPRPPIPRAYSASPLPPEAYVFGSPVLIPVPTGVGRGHYIPQQQLADNPLEDPFHRPPSGGPVKRNDAEYRWVTDASKYEVREIDFPCVSEKVSTSVLALRQFKKKKKADKRCSGHFASECRCWAPFCASQLSFGVTADILYSLTAV
ncbi:hypothetical protein SK128_011573 [Halocaridina rubra]|uniref:Uncharacterized protein n=1 Tax=Halocaridina rubra TaxID=373956 RepID=A0AAN9A258_HALRR